MRKLHVILSQRFGVHQEASMTIPMMEAEAILIDSLSKDVGVRTNAPDDPEERWNLLRSLMNIRSPTPVSNNILMIQDELLSVISDERGITDADDFEFRNGIALWMGDITTLKCDAIVNAANSRMLGCFVPCHRCIDNAIHTYAGMQLRLECARIMNGRMASVGEAMVTNAYNLPCEKVIHTVGPMVEGQVTPYDETALRACYISCMDAAAANGLRTIAFCCISTGEFRFPNRLAAEIAVSSVRVYLESHPGMRVIFNVFKEEDHEIYRELLGRN